MECEISYFYVGPLPWTTGRENPPHITGNNFFLPLSTIKLFVIPTFYSPTDAGIRHLRGLTSEMRNFIFLGGPSSLDDWSAESSPYNRE